MYHAGMCAVSTNPKTIVVTGASSGIGEATALRLAATESRVVMVSRNKARGIKARDRILRRHPGASLDVLVADLSTRKAIEDLAAAIKSKYQTLDVLINNAAVMTSTRRVTPEGFELQFFVNHLAYFLLTGHLLDLIRASAPSRIINVASTAHSRGIIDFDDLQLKTHYRGYQAYASTKLMNVIFTYELARRLEGTGVTVNCLHPGVIRTGLMRGVSPVIHVLWQSTGKLFKQPSEGADTPVYLATSPEVDGVTGKYFRKCSPLGTNEISYDREVQKRLFAESERLTGFHYPV